MNDLLQNSIEKVIGLRYHPKQFPMQTINWLPYNLLPILSYRYHGYFKDL
jgi:hypothetical protein